MEEILAASDRAAELTKQLLAFSRRQAVSTHIFHLDEVVANIERMLRRVIGEDIELVVSSEPGLGLVRADRGQLEQVLVNLVVNARDAMPKGGTLNVPYVRLSVADTGAGMDPETAAQIFEPFFTTKEAGRGTGLGLAIVYGVVERAGGLIEVDTAIGRGTTFHLYLPQTADDESPDHSRVAVESRAATLPTAEETVLLVEDDRRLSSLISKTLRMAGYQVLEAEHGDHALDLARTHHGRIDLLLSDVVMPGINGRTLSDQITSVHPETEVLFMSGHSDETVFQHGVQPSSVPFIQKPFSMAALMVKIRETLQGPPSARGAH